MSIKLLKTVFADLGASSDWSIQVLRISVSKRKGVGYTGRLIHLDPPGRLLEFVKEISDRYVSEPKGILHMYSDVSKYDGSTMADTVYKLSGQHPLIVEEYQALIKAAAKPDAEIDPFALSPQAYLLKGRVTYLGVEQPIKLISMQKPVTQLKHKFLGSNGTFREIEKPVLTLRPAIDAVIFQDTVYMLTLAAENLFHMERSYKSVCSEKMAEVTACSILTDAEAFCNIAGSGQNPRKFLSFNASRLESLKDKDIRKAMARKFSIPFDGDKFDTSQEAASEKLVKLLCNKGMLDPCLVCIVEKYSGTSSALVYGIHECWLHFCLYYP